MSINSIIMTALQSIGVPVSFQKYTGSAPTYITFFCYNQQGEEWAENREIATGFYVQVDVWSESDYTSLVDNVKTAMEEAGFIRKTAQDLYEDDTGIYHKAMRFSYVQNN